MVRLPSIARGQRWEQTSAREWNAQADAVRTLLDRVAALELRSEPSDRLPRSGAPFWLARITGWEQIGTLRRWRYAWTEVSIDAAGDDQTWPAARSGKFASGDTTWALNLFEINNVADGAGTQGNSVKENRPGFPAAFDLQPVGGGAGGVPENQVIVPMFTYSAEGGSGRTLFWYTNSHDGACP